MEKLRSAVRLGLGTGLAVLVVASVIPSAQSRDADSVLVLKELVAEVRGLRVVIERYTETQLQTQAASDLVSVQQRRVAEATARADALRRELEAASGELRQMTQELAGAQAEQRLTTDLAKRAHFEEMERRFNGEIERLNERERELRGRESELLNLLATEEGKWNELVGRLEQWLRR